jgi:hypothetical protein
MLTKEIVSEVKAAKARDTFNSKLNSLYPNPQGYYLPSQFKDAVMDALIYAVPALAERLKTSPINNNTANAVASKLERH